MFVYSRGWDQGDPGESSSSDMFQIRTGSAVAQFSKERPFHLRWAIVESSAFSEWVQISRITNTNLKSRQRRCKVYLVGYISTADRERLDYVEDFQDIYTSSETFDVEVFFIPSEGLFMAAANKYWLSCFNVKDCNMRTGPESCVLFTFMANLSLVFCQGLSVRFRRLQMDERIISALPEHQHAGGPGMETLYHRWKGTSWNVSANNPISYRKIHEWKHL